MKKNISLDNAATTQIHPSAIDAMMEYWNSGRSNVGRGLYPLAEESMNHYESARASVAQFTQGGNPPIAQSHQCVFTKSVTESLNMLAFGLASKLSPGDEILVSPFEHHANLLPWRRIAQDRGAILRTMPMTVDFMLDLDGAKAMMNNRTKIIAITLVSNVLGTIVPVAEIADAAHHFGAIVIVDAAQAAPHIPIDVDALGADALTFSSHKCRGPNGIAALILSNHLIASLNPMLLGGGMVDHVTNDGATWKSGVEKFEAGSPNVEGAIGFAAALKWIQEQRHPRECGDPENMLRPLLINSLRSIPEITIYNPTSAVAIVAFTVANLHPHDVADMLGKRGVCIRAGHCCAAPLVEKLSPNGICRVSLGANTTVADIDALVIALKEIIVIANI